MKDYERTVILGNYIIIDKRRTEKNLAEDIKI